MIVYKKNNKPYLLFIILFTLLLITIPLNNKYYKSIIWNVYDNILTYDLGFSSIPNLIDIKESNNYIEIPKKLSNIFINYFFGVDNRPNIKRLDLNIKFKEYRHILDDRERFIKQGMGNNFTEVKGKIIFNGNHIKGKIRLKGDLIDHWRSIYKMSFRIKLKDNYVMGYKTFSLQKPSARQHPYDQTFQSLQRKLGNLSSSHNYVHLYVNGKSWGIMNIEEHMSKEFLEKQRIKESLIIKFGNEKKWLIDKKMKTPYPFYKISSPKLDSKVYGANKYFNNKENIYRKWYSYILKEHMNNNIDLYDLNAFSKSLVLSLAWGTTHTLANSNSRYYFNPYTLKLMPITTDQGGFKRITNKLRIPYEYRTVSHSNILKKFEYYDIESVIDKSQEVINKYQSYFPLDEPIANTILLNNFNKIKNNIYDNLTIKKNKLSNKLVMPSNEQVPYITDHIYAKHFKNGEIYIYNLLPEEVELLSISVDNLKIKNIQDKIINGYSQKDSYIPLIIKTNLKNIIDNKIIISTKYRGYKRQYKLGYTNLVNGLYNPLLNSTKLEDLEFISIVNNIIKIKSGNWNINKPLVIDGNLIIEEGTILNFSEDSYLIVKGSLTAISKSNKIILKAKDKRWKGIYIINAETHSILKNVIIQDTKALTDGILNLTGGVTFYKSNVNIINTKFINSIAEDSLNIVHSKFLIDNIVINNSISDGFDSDYSEGDILNSKFINISGDAVDFSGSTVNIKDCSFIYIHDKAISSGEASNININTININNVGVGIASKDGSITLGTNIKITKYKMNALMTYMKKLFYNHPKLILNNIEIDDKSKGFSRQKNTIMIIDGQEVEERKIDVKKMYKSGVMKK
ncbi:MAG: hypothetical protein DRG78_01600 [Epsilonproteobacteria bacterium]|nr:MAG: hypothetical protein DRG78_01600 [Campylobacterota bacterium]